MIPKIIHYCWFSDSMPVDVKYYIRSWKKLMPDYEFKKWSRAEFDAVNPPLFAKQALSVGKFAFAADWVRFYALYTEGGFYLDCDVLVLKNFENLRNNGFVTAMEKNADPLHPYFKELLDENHRNNGKVGYIPNLAIQAAIMGSESGNVVPNRMLSLYENMTFIKEDGSLNMNVISPQHLAKIMDSYGYRYVDKEQIFSDGIKIVPEELLCSMRSHVTDKTYAVHCSRHAWVRAVPKLEPFYNMAKACLLELKYNRFV